MVWRLLPTERENSKRGADGKEIPQLGFRLVEFDGPMGLLAGDDQQVRGHRGQDGGYALVFC